MIAISTGIKGLDEALNEKLGDSQIIYYREFLLKDQFATVIISNKLKGGIEMEQLLFSLKQSSSRVIYLTSENAKEEIQMCIKLGIYDLLFDPIKEQDVMEILNTPKEFSDISKVFVKYVNDEEDTWKVKLGDFIKIDNENKQQDNEFKEDYDVKLIEKETSTTKTKTVKQRVYAFYTTDNNLDKNDVLLQVSCLLAKKSDQKILVIDMDPLTPSLHHFFNVKKETIVKDIYDLSVINTGLTAVYNAIEKKIFAADLLEDLAHRHKKLDNLYILTGIYDINMTDLFEAKHYEELIEKAKDIYDTVIINTHPDIALVETYTAFTYATDIIVVSNANYTYGRNTNFILNYLIDYQKFPKSKFKIIVNNLSKHSLDRDVMSRIFKGYEILGYLPFNAMREGVLNKQKTPFILTSYASKDLSHYLEIIEKLGYIPKTTLLSKLFGSKKAARDVCNEEIEEIELDFGDEINEEMEG